MGNLPRHKKNRSYSKWYRVQLHQATQTGGTEQNKTVHRFTKKSGCDPMNDILHAEQDIKNYLFYNHNTCVNFVCRQFKYEPFAFPTDYAIQCTVKNGLFKKMVQLVEKLNIDYSISIDKPSMKCIVLKKPEDILTIANHIQEVEL